MCHLSPTVHLAWAILSCGLQVFLIQHLWRYDRFKCLAWSSGRQPGTFKRIMTYSYLMSVPCLVVYSVTMAVLKYRNGYRFIPGHGIVPTPYQLWTHSDQSWLRPLYILFAVTWGLELVTHLEELMFWLFLIHQGPERRDWFSSIEFKGWALGSCLAMAGLPITAVLTRADPLRAEAYIFLVGSASSTLVTLFFFLVLARFPAFLRQVKKEGAAGPVILRLVKFHELNILRVIFRIFMTIPLLILGIDGVLPEHIINESTFWTDLLAFLAAVGLIVSSTMTLLIFFPRSLAEDSGWRPRTLETTSQYGSYVSAATERSRFVQKPLLITRPTYTNRNSYPSSPISDTADARPYHDPPNLIPPTTENTAPPILSKTKIRYSLNGQTSFDPDFPQYEMRNIAHPTDDNQAHLWDEHTDLHRRESGVSYTTGDSETRRPDKDTKVRMMELAQVIDAGMKKPLRPPRLHPYITSFHSPIDLLQYVPDSEGPHAV